MLAPLLLLSLSSTLDAVASPLSAPASGGYAEVTGAFAGAAPGGIRPGYGVGVGLWKGKYDDAYALGRFGALGLHVSQGFSGEGAFFVPSLEARRGMDLFVVKTWYGLRAGPELHGGALGWQATLTGGAKWRFANRLGAIVRADLGAGGLSGQIGARYAVALGVEYSSPWSR